MYKYFFFFIFTMTIIPQQFAPTMTAGSMGESYFIENKGQWPDEVRYLTKVGGLNAWITDNGVVYEYYAVKRNFTEEELRSKPLQEQNDFEIENTEFLSQVVRINYLNSSPDAGDKRLDKKNGHHNYYVGDPSTHAEFVALYGEVQVSELYEGIDIRYYFDEGRLRYDYKAAPDADISHIQMSVNGADAVTVNTEGELVMQTQFGETVHGKLLAYQNEWYGLKPVECGFVVNNDGTVVVNTAEYDRNKALTIDPLVVSTYIGGSDTDRGTDVAMTSANDYVIAGYTRSTNFPVTTGPSHSGDYDFFIAQFSISPSTTLEYATYYGGSGLEYSRGIDIGNYQSNASEYVYVCGYTSDASVISPTYSITAALTGNQAGLLVAIQTSNGLKNFDLVFDAGSNDSFEKVIHSDSEELLIIAGNINSSNFPNFEGSLQGSQDAFLLVIPDGAVPSYTGIYLGGSGYEVTNGMDILPVAGDAFISGSTLSTDFVGVTVGTQLTNNGRSDAFIVNVDYGDPTVPTPPTLVNATYFGGSEDETDNVVAVSQLSSDVYLTGSTKSTDLTIKNAYDPTHNGGSDIFAISLDNLLSALDYSTYYGGSDNEYCMDMVLNEGLKPVVAGYTYSDDIPTSNSADYKTRTGDSDVFIMEMNTDGSNIAYASYYGGTGTDYPRGICYKQDDNVVFAGQTESTNYPLLNQLYSSNAGDEDAFLTHVIMVEGNKTVTVDTPNGGEKWEANATQTIEWTSLDITNVDIFYTLDGAAWHIIVSNYDASLGSYDWLVPGSSSINCYIRVADASDFSIRDESDAPFEIAYPSVHVVTPNGGESWEAGTAQSIEWTYFAVDNVKLEYTTGSGWNTIVNSIDASLGSFNWTVPNTPSTTCKVRVSDASQPLINDVSNAVFEIFASSITVNTPNGGETFRAGATETIEWTATGIDNVKLEYSTDNGSNWNVIDPSVAGSLGTYDWTVPNVSSTQALVRLSDELDPSISDVSNSVFTIGDPTATISYDAGWNILSVPWTLDDPVASNVFTDMVSDVFAYSYGYYVIYNLQPENGFWIKMSATGSETVNGQGYSDNVIHVFTGWNIIGALEYDVAVASIVESTSGMVVSDYYEYDGGYTNASNLETGKGYWVKVSQPGTLTLPNVPPKVEPLFTPEKDWITVTVADAAGNSQQLYLADAAGNFELPPLPPNEIFDARFGDDTYISSEATANQLRFQSEDYPLTITVTNGNLKLTDGATGTIINRQLLDGESMTITNKNIRSLNLNTIEIPADYVLYQNYPNPFNPATTIKFGLPQAGKVDITVYNQLGQEVETLISEELEAGYHELEWNAMNYSSGVYFYTINAGSFKSVKKMLLLK